MAPCKFFLSIADLENFHFKTLSIKYEVTTPGNFKSLVVDNSPGIIVLWWSVEAKSDLLHLSISVTMDIGCSGQI